MCYTHAAVSQKLYSIDPRRRDSSYFFMYNFDGNSPATEKKKQHFQYNRKIL